MTLTSLHRHLTGEEVHTGITYTYADETARLAATGFVAQDVTKLALQTDNSTVWVLTDHDTITWSPCGTLADHASSHENDGTDEIDITGLSGQLADDQPALVHSIGGTKHSVDTLANLNSKISDAILDDSSDPRTPTSHGASHENGGVDEVSISGLSGQLADDQPSLVHTLGGSKHNADTLANLNTKISDATLDDSGDLRDPNNHAANHTDGTDDIQNATTGQKGLMTIAQVLGLENLIQILTDRSEPTGLFNDTDSIMSWSDSSPDRTFTIDKAVTSFEYYIKGVKYTKTGPDTHQIPDTEGLHFIYYDGSSLGSTIIFSSILLRDYAIVALVYWDATNKKAIIFGEERHKFIWSWAEHYYQHLTKGAIWSSGLALGDIIADASGDLDTHATCSVGNGVIFDEDIEFSIVHGSPQTLTVPAQIPVYYLEGSGANQRMTTVNNFPVKPFSGGSNRLAFNELGGSGWQQTEAGQGSFICAHLYATTNRFAPIIARQGIAEYATLAEAINGANNEIFEINVSPLCPEFVAIGTVIYQTSTAYTNSVQGRIRALNGAVYKDWRRAESVAGSPGVSAHNELTGVQGGDADEQYHLFESELNKLINVDKTLSAGLLEGGVITDAGGETINVALGTGKFRSSSAYTAPLFELSWSAASGLSITTNTIRYVGVEYNSGSPQVVVKTTDSWNRNDEFPLGSIANQGGTLHVLNNPLSVANTLEKIIHRFYDTLPKQRAERLGGLILGETGTRNLTVSASEIYDRVNEFDIPAIDTSVADTFDSYSSGGEESTGNTQWDNDNYDNAGTLISLSANRYANLWFYVELDGSFVCVYGTEQYLTVASAENESPPVTLPYRLSAHGVLIGRLIFQKGDSTAQLIESAFSSVFNPSVATEHNNLSGIQGGTVGEYNHLDNAQHTVATQAATASLDGFMTSTYANKLDGAEVQSNKNAASGYPGLDGASKLTGSQQLYGTSLDTACEGDDSRLSDARTPIAHLTSHENGGSDEISVAGLSGQLADDQPLLAHTMGGAKHTVDTLANLNTKISDATLDDSGDPRDPNAHNNSHQNGGADEISVAGLSGLLADGQTPLVHSSSHENGGSDEINVGGLSGQLADEQLPADHASDHQDTGTDTIPVTSTTATGLMPRSNLGASSNPTTNDDVGDGYVVGSRWINTTTDEEFVCVDNTSSAAVWNSTTAGLVTHASTHENGGGDEISVAGLSGQLADDQPALAHTLGGSKHTTDTLANLNSKISDATLDDSGDPRDPTTHATSHQNGGSDEVATATPGANVIPKSGGDSKLAVGFIPDLSSTYLIKSLFNANTILAANVDDTPIAVSLAQQTVLGRLTGGNIDDVALGIADNNVVQIDHASVADNDYTKFTANGVEGRSYAEVRNDLDLVIERMQFFADMFNSPTNANWAVNALAPLAADSNDAGLLVRLLDDTAEEGVGWTAFIPTGATNMKLTFISRPETAPGAARTVGLKLYERGVVGSVDAWSAGTTLSDIDITTNENWLYDTEPKTIASWGLTAGQAHQFELTRVTPTGGTDLTGDWALFAVMVEFT